MAIFVLPVTHFKTCWLCPIINTYQAANCCLPKAAILKTLYIGYRRNYELHHFWLLVINESFKTWLKLVADNSKETKIWLEQNISYRYTDIKIIL